jgi:hypothetical protein
MASLGVLSSSPFEPHPQFLQLSLMVAEPVSGEYGPFAAQRQLSLDGHNTMPGGSMLSRAFCRSYSL